ncbi:MAG: hypothetical protein Q8S24_03295 [Eubacteriales bacterium]|nr:hypothetical protein [Eubacteriales bacterium]
MKYTAKDITLIALTGALTVVIGYVFYIIGSFLPVPGHKFVIFAPFLSFMMFIPVRKIQRIGVMTAVSIVFAALMVPVTFFMALAIFLTGLSAELTAFLLFRDYKTTWKMIGAVAFYPTYAILWAFATARYFTGNAIYTLVGGWTFVIVLCLLIYGLGLLGGYLSNRVIFKRLKHLDESRPRNI